MNTRAEGAAGEAEAVKSLISLGYKILERNIISAGVELDIVAEYGGTVIFIEVKARSTMELGSPAEAVGYYKQRRYINAAKMYIALHKLAGRDIRFDVVEVIGGKINHIENAFWEK